MVLGSEPEVEWHVGKCPGAKLPADCGFAHLYVWLSHFIRFVWTAKVDRQQKLEEENPDYMLKGGDDLLYEPVEALSDDRISFNPFENVPNAMLIINATTLDDRGRYNCTAKNKASLSGDARYKHAERGCYVRVKGNWLDAPTAYLCFSNRCLCYISMQTGKLAALWPFLGICAEVLILCAIILIYEKRRNKEGMDESDTDQSPEQ